MINISVLDAVRTLQAANQALSPRQIATATSRAINESIMQGRTEARASVKRVYNIPQKYVKGVNIQKSSAVSLTGKIYASSKPIPMDAFAPKFETASGSVTVSKKGIQQSKKFKKAKASPKAGVSIMVIPGKREIIPFAFMIKGARPRVFARGAYKDGTSFGFTQRNKRVNKSGSDTPIKPLISVSVHGAVINKESMAAVGAKVNTVFPVAIERNISFLLSKIGT